MTEGLRTFLLVILFSASALAAERVQCGSVKGRSITSSVGYCAMLPPSYDAQPRKKFPVLYFLHGLGGDQSFLVSSGGWQLIEDLWEQKQIGQFVIITPEADSSFYINSKDGRVKYEDFFIRDFIPQMEKKFRLGGTRSTRAIAGVSMGGYGAVSAHMPALLESLPRGTANAGLSPFLGPAFGSPTDEAFWKASSPFVFARKANLAGLKIYFDCGDRDDFGFDAGTRQMDKLLTDRHVAHVAHIYPGQHDWQYVAKHLRESLEFDSRAMGLR
jgi:S-formylglutathione hydrolase FrmB